MAKTMKTAITIPNEDFQVIESLRKSLKKSRSQILVDAFHDWLKHRQVAQWDKEYEVAYRKMPTTEEERKFTEMSPGEREVWKENPW